MDSDVQAVQKIVDTGLLKPRYSYPMFKNAPRPPVDAYAAVRLMGTYSPGYDQVYNTFDEVADEFVFTTKGFRILSFDVLFSRDDGDVDFLNNSFFRPDVLDLMKKLGMVLISKGPILVKTLTLESQWEVRTAIRLDFNVIRKQVTRIPRIVTAGINGHITNGGTLNPTESAYQVWLSQGNTGSEEDFFNYLAAKAVVSPMPDNRLVMKADGLHVFDGLSPDPLDAYIQARE